MARGSRQRVGTFLKFVNGEAGSISVGDIIALSKTIDNTAIRAQATDLTRMPAIGIAKRVTAEKVVVQVDSVYKWPDSSSVSITTGKDYWVSSSIGELTDDSSTVSSGFLQLIGVGKQAPRKILIRTDPQGILLG